MIKNITLYVKGLLQRHPMLAGVAVAIMFTLFFNLHSLFSAATLPALLCLLIIGLCMKSMGGKTTCEQKVQGQSLLIPRPSKTQVIDRESHHA